VSASAAIVQGRTAVYPERAPFHPEVRDPEAWFPETGPERNAVYEAVRRCFQRAGWDAPHSGTTAWNPLAAWIRPGRTVLLKPDLVKESHPRDPRGRRYAMTHGSFSRAVLDYVVPALGGHGRVWLVDAPQTDSSWDEIVRVLQLDRLVSFDAERGVDLEPIDLRQQE